MLKFHPVESSFIEALAYDAESGIFGVRFLNSDYEYHYTGVPLAVARSVFTARSHGKAYHYAIRAVYQWTKQKRRR